ncbi:MAG TPA: IS6 family transposase [Candidatus Competibacter sp.]|nr:IS6 family transposase [Candidatus Competibacteraceae bacterium]HPE72376.1 IS6 family transposase [Candidatus Competibacter sp.]
MRTGRIDFKDPRFEQDILLTSVRGYRAYPLPDRDREARLAERGVDVDHSRVYRGVQKFTPPLEVAFRKGQKRPVSMRWRMDETTIKIQGPWKSLDRAVNQEGQTLDVRLTVHRDQKTARRFFKKAIGPHSLPEKVTIDKGGANTAALDALQEETGAAIEVSQINHLNNRVEQDHRTVKRIIRPMRGFHTFRSTRVTLPGIELLHRIKKGPMQMTGGRVLSAAEPFYSLAASFRPEISELV